MEIKLMIIRRSLSFKLKVNWTRILMNLNQQSRSNRWNSKMRWTTWLLYQGKTNRTKKIPRKNSLNWGQSFSCKDKSKEKKIWKLLGIKLPDQCILNLKLWSKGPKWMSKCEKKSKYFRCRIMINLASYNHLKNNKRKLLLRLLCQKIPRN